MGREEKLKKIANDVRFEVQNRLYPWVDGKSIERCSNAALISLVMALVPMIERIEDVMTSKVKP